MSEPPTHGPVRGLSCVPPLALFYEGAVRMGFGNRLQLDGRLISAKLGKDRLQIHLEVTALQGAWPPAIRTGMKREQTYVFEYVRLCYQDEATLGFGGFVQGQGSLLLTLRMPPTPS